MSWQILFQQREIRISWWLSNNSEIHLFLWKHAFSLLEKTNLVPNKKLLLNVPFQSTKCRKKELSVDNKVRESIGDVYCPTCRNEKCVYISTNKMTSFYDCKKCKAGCNVLNFPLRTKNRQLCCLAVTVHIVLQER